MNRTFKLLPLAVLITTAWAAQAQQVAYSPEMIRALVPAGQDVDMSFIEKGYNLPPGVYRFELRINGDHFANANYEVRDYDGALEPVLRVKEIRALPLKDEVLKQFVDMDENAEVFPISSKIEGVRFTVNSQEMKLEMSIPQIHVAENDGWVDIASEDLWDYGETGAVLNYTVTGTHLNSRSSDYESTNLYANLSGKFNIGAWRLHSSGAFSVNHVKAGDYSSNTHEWDLWNTYLQRDVPAVKGTLQIGEINTSGEIFDTIPLRGVRLSTNEQMLPRRDRTYAPIIEGIANTNAQILIRQNGHVVHTVNVAPGPFRLENLPSFGNYGDLEVVIRESDGTERIMMVPYSSVPNMLREGQFRYDFNAGRYYRKNMSSKVKDTPVFMGTLGYGLPYDVTLYGGTILANDYYAFALGTGLSMGRYGALAADVIQSTHEGDDYYGVKEGSGAAWRLRYEKTLMETGTTVNLANYQYITGNYATLEEYVSYGTPSSSLWAANGKMRSRWQLSLTQQLGDYGSLSLGADYATYHGSSPDVKTFNVGYYTSVNGVGVSLNYGRNYQQVGAAGNRHWDSSHSVMLNLNIPFDLFFKHSTSSFVNNTSVSYQGRMDKSMSGEKTYRQSVVMTGYSDDLDWNWTASQELGGHEDRASSINLAYQGDRFGANMGYDHNHYADSYHLGMNGALVFHRTGITAASRAYDSIAIVEVPDVSGVRVSQYFDTKTDYFGHGVMSYLTNYTKNEIAIDPATLPEGAMLLDSSNRVVIPVQGSIVRVTYPVRFGQQAVFILQSADGKPLPFGSTVALLDGDGKVDPVVQGLVGEGGRVYLTALPQTGTLTVKVGEGQKIFKYELPEKTESQNGDFISVVTQTLTSVN